MEEAQKLKDLHKETRAVARVIEEALDDFDGETDRLAKPGGKSSHSTDNAEPKSWRSHFLGN
jgi:hypothetical protein